MTLRVGVWQGWNLPLSDLDGAGCTQHGMAHACGTYELWDLEHVIFFLVMGVIIVPEA